jgi:hypothetical protein
LRPNHRDEASVSVIVATALIATILVSLIAAFEYSQVANLRSQNTSLQMENRDLSVQVSGGGLNSSLLFKSWLSHIDKLESHNVTAVLEDYVPNATMTWSGTTHELGGRYAGINEMNLTFQAFFSHTAAIYFVIQSFNSTSNTNGTAEIEAVTSFFGSSRSIGPYNGTISMKDEYLYLHGKWMISQEMWNFESFVTAYPVQIF